MSADNYYRICRHPKGGFAAVMGFASDDARPEPEDQDPQFGTWREAYDYADQDTTTEYGVQLDPDITQPDAADELATMILERLDVLSEINKSTFNAAHPTNCGPVGHAGSMSQLETLRESTWRERQQAKADVADALERLEAKRAEVDIARRAYWDALRREGEAIQRNIDAWKDTPWEGRGNE